MLFSFSVFLLAFLETVSDSSMPGCVDRVREVLSQSKVPVVYFPACASLFQDTAISLYDLAAVIHVQDKYAAFPVFCKYSFHDQPKPTKKNE